MFRVSHIYKFIEYYLLCRIAHKTPSGPLFIYLELTKDCNLRCQFCDLWRIKDHDSTAMSNDLSLSEIINFIDEAKKMGTVLIYLVGGEPLLRPDIIEIVREINKRGLAFSLVTNATLLSKEIIKNLAHEGLRHIVISIDSSFPEIHDELRGVRGTFEKVAQSIGNIKMVSDKIKISINTVITKTNFRYLMDIAKLSRKLKAEVIEFIPVQKIYPQSPCYPQDKNIFFTAQDDIEALEKELNRVIDFLSKTKIETYSYEFLKGIPDFYRNKKTDVRCLAGYILCEIDSSGNVYSCNGLSERIGNVREDKFSKIWDSEKFNRQRKKVIGCHNCWMNCYIEPSLRFSLKYQIKNFPKTIKEYRRFLC